MQGSAHLLEMLNEYEKSHKNKTNQLIHKFCVPLIIFSLLILLEQIPFPINLKYIFIISSFIYYFKFKNLKVYFVILSQIIPMLIISNMIPEHQRLTIGISIFVVAWIGQLVGHKIEGAKPSFIQDIQYLWIGPLWITKSLVKF